MAGLGGHLSQQDIELIEAGVHPVINKDYTLKESPRSSVDKEHLITNQGVAGSNPVGGSTKN